MSSSRVLFPAWLPVSHCKLCFMHQALQALLTCCDVYDGLILPGTCVDMATEGGETEALKK